MAEVGRPEPSLSDEAREAIVLALEVLDTFRRVYDIQPPGHERWSDEKPNAEFIPGAWPRWGSFRQAKKAWIKLRALMPEPDEEAKP